MMKHLRDSLFDRACGCSGGAFHDATAGCTPLLDIYVAEYGDAAVGAYRGAKRAAGAIVVWV
jgi:hypothetical protein